MVNSSLSVVSLNVDGMRDPKRRSLMFDYLNRYEYDIALLQDTRILNNRECMQWNAKCRCRGFWSVGTVHSLGVGILICDPAKFEGISFDVDFDGRVCVCDLTFNGTPLRVVNIYAPTVGTDRLNFLSQLDKYLLTRRKVIMGGDFNLVLDIAMDCFGGNPHGSIGSPELKRLLSKYHFIDIWRHQHPSLKTCTWSNTDRSIMSRLDKFYISVDLVDDSKIVTGIHQCHLSDHDLVSFHIFYMHHVLTWGRGVWKMNTSLLKHVKLRTEIISFWSDWTEAKMLFSDVGEWWDEGKAEIKHIIIKYSKAVRQQINEQ
jgi:exonuclease III